MWICFPCPCRCDGRIGGWVSERSAPKYVAYGHGKMSFLMMKCAMPVAPTQTLPRVAGEGTIESLREFHANVTVAIVNWNGERFLDRCLFALLAQTVAPHEIILVDNASSDAVARHRAALSIGALAGAERKSGFCARRQLGVQGSFF